MQPISAPICFTEVLIPEVRQRTRLRRLRNLAVLVVAIVAIGYFTVIHRPASPKPSTSANGGTPSAAVLTNTNADVVSFRESDYHPAFTLPPGSPVTEERGWALGNGRETVIHRVTSRNRGVCVEGSLVHRGTLTATVVVEGFQRIGSGAESDRTLQLNGEYPHPSERIILERD